MGRRIQISDAEWEIMKVLWQNAGLTAAEVSAALAPRQQWHPKTVRTMLNRLQNKGVLEAIVRDRAYHYTPLASRDECISAATSSFISRVFDGALSPMLAHFVKATPLSKKDRADLERILSKYDGRETK